MKKYPEDDVERCSDSQEVGEPVLTRTIDQRVRLVPDRSHKARRRSKHDGDEKWPWIYAEWVCRSDRDRREKGTGGIVRHHLGKYGSQDIKDRNTDAILDSGVEKIVTADPHAYNALKKDYTDLPPVEHISRIIGKKVQEKNRILGKQWATDRRRMSGWAGKMLPRKEETCLFWHQQCGGTKCRGATLPLKNIENKVLRNTD